MQSSGNGLKQVGVLTNNPGAPSESAPPKKMTHVAEAKMYVVRYGDEQGVAHAVTVIRAGDQWYLPENSEQWSKNLRPIAPWLAKQLVDAVAPTTAPKPDTVDVLGAG